MRTARTCAVGGTPLLRPQLSGTPLPLRMLHERADNQQWCPHPDSNRNGYSPTDFKSVVSTYSTMRAVCCYAVEYGSVRFSHSVMCCCVGRCLSNLRASVLTCLGTLVMVLGSASATRNSSTPAIHIRLSPAVVALLESCTK